MGMQPFTFEQISPFLEEDETGRRLIFGGLLPEGIQGRQRQQAEGLFIPTFNQFLGQLGRDLRQGNQSQSFSQFAQRNLPQSLATLPMGQTPGVSSRQQFGF